MQGSAFIHMVKVQLAILGFTFPIYVRGMVKYAVEHFTVILAAFCFNIYFGHFPVLAAGTSAGNPKLMRINEILEIFVGEKINQQKVIKVFSRFKHNLLAVILSQPLVVPFSRVLVFKHMIRWRETSLSSQFLNKFKEVFTSRVRIDPQLRNKSYAGDNLGKVRIVGRVSFVGYV